MNSSENPESEKLARIWTNRKKEMDEKLLMWRYDVKTISLLPDYPVINKKKEDDIQLNAQIDWQSPVCRISLGTDVQILANVLEGLLVAFPVDAIHSKSDNGKVAFYSEKLPLSGEILVGQRIKIFINGQLHQEYEIQ
jgi:hypothetical protein